MDSFNYNGEFLSISYKGCNYYGKAKNLGELISEKNAVIEELSGIDVADVEAVAAKPAAAAPAADAASRSGIKVTFMMRVPDSSEISYTVCLYKSYTSKAHITIVPIDMWVPLADLREFILKLSNVYGLKTPAAVDAYLNVPLLTYDPHKLLILKAKKPVELTFGEIQWLNTIKLFDVNGHSLQNDMKDEYFMTTPNAAPGPRPGFAYFIHTYNRDYLRQYYAACLSFWSYVHELDVMNRLIHDTDHPTYVSFKIRVDMADSKDGVGDDSNEALSLCVKRVDPAYWVYWSWRLNDDKPFSISKGCEFYYYPVEELVVNGAPTADGIQAKTITRAYTLKSELLTMWCAD